MPVLARVFLLARAPKKERKIERHIINTIKSRAKEFTQESSRGRGARSTTWLLKDLAQRTTFQGWVYDGWTVNMGYG